MTEHPIAQGLGLAAIITGFALDSLGKTEYFSWAAKIIVVVLLYVAYEVYTERKMYKTKVLPIPIVVNINSDITGEYALNSLFEEIEKNSKFKNLKANLKKYRNIIEDDLVFTYKGDLYKKEEIITFMQIIRYQVRKIKENIPNQVEFHLAYYKRPAYGIFLGYVFEEEDLVIYQNKTNHDSFYKVAEIDNRDYKNVVSEFQKFNIKYLKQDENSEQLLIGIKASSHNINFNTEGLKDYTNVISIEAKHSGTIQPEEDWVLYVREIFTVLNEEQTKYKQITIAHNMPESIGVILGMAVGHHWRLLITQYDKGDYIEVMRTDELDCYY